MKKLATIATSGNMRAHFYCRLGTFPLRAIQYAMQCTVSLTQD